VQGWRYYDYKVSEEPELNAFLVGLIPFERIVNIDWEGDEYYSIPHIYCEFAEKHKQPYEKLIFCSKERGLGPPWWYKEIVDYKTVMKASEKYKKKHRS
jgi:hypothetical protein